MKALHAEQHPLAGQTVTLTTKVPGPPGEPKTGAEFRVEDWYDRVSNGSWMHAAGNPAAMKYGMRAGFGGLPPDNEVVYGKIGNLGHLVHVSELPS